MVNFQSTIKSLPGQVPGSLSRAWAEAPALLKQRKRWPPLLLRRWKSHCGKTHPPLTHWGRGGAQGRTAESSSCPDLLGSAFPRWVGLEAREVGGYRGGLSSWFRVREEVRETSASRPPSPLPRASPLLVWSQPRAKKGMDFKWHK